LLELAAALAGRIRAEDNGGMVIDLLLHALREILDKPPLLILASLIVTVLATLLIVLLLIVFMGRRAECRIGD
jgi:hypothetical protein